MGLCLVILNTYANTLKDSMADIHLNNVSKRWGSFVGVEKFNLDIADKEFLVLLGPSGCGKTTTMRMIAGLEDVSEGCLLYTSPSPRDLSTSRMPSSA